MPLCTRFFLYSRCLSKPCGSACKRQDKLICGRSFLYLLSDFSPTSTQAVDVLVLAYLLRTITQKAKEASKEQKERV